MAPPSKKAKAKAAPQGAGLAKFFTASQTTTEPQKSEAVAAVAPPPPPPLAAPSAAAEEPKAKENLAPSSLTAEQLQRIEENKRRAQERKALKRTADAIAKDDTNTSTPLVDPKAAPAPTEATPDPDGSPKREEVADATKKISPQRPPTPTGRGAPKKGAKPTPEKSNMPAEKKTPGTAAGKAKAKAKASPSNDGTASAPTPRPSAKFSGIDAGKLWMQYNDLYGLRLKQLRHRVVSESQALWAGEVRVPCESGAAGSIDLKAKVNEPTVVFGIIFRELSNRTNVIQHYKEHCSSTVCDDVDKIFCSDSDTVWLEDQGRGRVRLDISSERSAGLVTGLICAVKGHWNESQSFTVSTWCFATSPHPPPALLAAPRSDAPFLALVSGLRFGDASSSSSAALRDRAADFLLRAAKAGGASLLGGGLVQRLIVCGDSVAVKEGSTGELTAAMGEADSFFDKVVGAMQIDVMPGHRDMSNYCLPQEPLHPYLFNKVRQRSGFKSVRNPYEEKFKEGFTLLGTSGQPVQDMLRCSNMNTALDALTLCYEASHLAPTAPDTLPTQPFKEMDPFVIDTAPHLLFSANHDRAANKWYPSRSGGDGNERAGTQCVIVPRFSSHPAIVLVNMLDPRDVRVQEIAAE